MHGSCLCGQVAYSVVRLASPPRHCSCHTCRKAHAAAFNTSAAVQARDFTWLRGEAALKSYESSPGKRRYFCGNCGTQLVARRDASETVALRVATLDEDPGQVPSAHIWVGSEPRWLAYLSGVRRFEAWEPDKP
jgi:ADP-ribosyl-[dinitrogen reductase] hydrolase